MSAYVCEDRDEKGVRCVRWIVPLERLCVCERECRLAALKLKYCCSNLSFSTRFFLMAKI